MSCCYFLLSTVMCRYVFPFAPICLASICPSVSSFVLICPYLSRVAHICWYLPSPIWYYLPLVAVVLVVVFFGGGRWGGGWLLWWAHRESMNGASSPPSDVMLLVLPCVFLIKIANSFGSNPEPYKAEGPSTQ